MNKAGIVDYGMCNLDSVSRAVEECGAKAAITDRRQVLEEVSHIILPGVGAFPDAMKNIQERFLDEILTRQAIEKQIPILGICLGMQLMSDGSNEIKQTEGLGWIPGQVRRFEPAGEENRIPHIGWNVVHPVGDSPLFKGIPPGKDFYFVHSYHLCTEQEYIIIAKTPYAGEFVSAVQRENIFGVQFHPEKSQRLGFQVLNNFLTI